jgi:hypothetical protein
MTTFRPHLMEIVAVTCRKYGIHDEPTQREVFDRAFNDLTRARSKDAVTVYRTVCAVKDAVEPYRKPQHPWRDHERQCETG